MHIPCYILILFFSIQQVLNVPKHVLAQHLLIYNIKNGCKHQVFNFRVPAINPPKNYITQALLSLHSPRDVSDALACSEELIYSDKEKHCLRKWVICV